MTDLLHWTLFLFLPLGWFARNVWRGYREPLPPTGTPAAAPDDSWLLLPFQAVFMAAWLCWALIALGLFLAPLAAVLWVVLR